MQSNSAIIHSQARATATSPAQPDSPLNREAAIVENIDRVRAIALRIKCRVPASVTVDDLVGAGTVGLIQAVDRFRPSRGLQFGTYAQHRIRGAMLDYLRGEDPLSRSERQRVRREAANDAGNGVESTPTTISLEEMPADELRQFCPDARNRSANIINRADLQSARRCLSHRENRVLSLLYEQDWQNNEVARELSVNESRVSQIKAAALTKLRAHLGDHRSGRAA